MIFPTCRPAALETGLYSYWNGLNCIPMSFIKSIHHNHDVQTPLATTVGQVPGTSYRVDSLTKAKYPVLEEKIIPLSLCIESHGSACVK